MNSLNYFCPFSCFLALHAGGHYQLKLLFGLVRCQSSCWQNRHFCAVFCSLKIMADSFFIKKLHHMLGPLPTAKNDAFVRQMQNTFCLCQTNAKYFLRKQCPYLFSEPICSNVIVCFIKFPTHYLLPFKSQLIKISFYSNSSVKIAVKQTYLAALLKKNRRY